jgi:hypothetical protein
VSDAFRYAEQRRHVFESDTSSTPLALGLEKRAVIAQSTHFDAARTLDGHIAVAVWRGGHRKNRDHFSLRIFNDTAGMRPNCCARATVTKFRKKTGGFCTFYGETPIAKSHRVEHEYGTGVGFLDWIIGVWQCIRAHVSETGFLSQRLQSPVAPL